LGIHQRHSEVAVEPLAAQTLRTKEAATTKGGTWQGRYYQDIAIDRVLEAIADGRDRILLTLATGTGKTFIAFQLAWKLFQSRCGLCRCGGRLLA
jgi:type I site-specific restriction endonuclease